MSLANSNSSPVQLIGTLIRGVGEPMLVVDSKGAVIDYNNQAKKLVGDDGNTPVEIGLGKMGITKDWFLQKVFSLPTSDFPINISTATPINSWSESQNVLCNRIYVDDNIYYTLILKNSLGIENKQDKLTDDELVDGFIQNTSLPVLLIDSNDFVIKNANSKALSFFDLPACKVVGVPLADFAESPSRFNSSLSSFVKNGYTGLELSFKTSKLLRSTEIHYSAIERKGQKVLLCILIDITQQNLAFSELQRIKNSLASEVASQTKDLVRINNALLEQIKNKQRIEQELRQSQELFMHLFRLNPNGLVLRELQSPKIIELNQSFLKIFGLKANETKGKTLDDFNLIINSKAYNQLLAELQEKRRLTDVPLTMMSNSGHVVFVEWSGEVVKVNDQEFILEVFHDITQTQIYQQKLVESEERYRTMFNNALVGISRARTTTGLISSCNRYFAQLIGYKAERDIVGKSIEKHFTNTKQRATFLSKLRANGSAIGEFELTTVQGKGIWVVDYAVINIEERYVDEVVVDITDRKIMENLLVSKEKRFRSMIEKASDLILIIDGEGEMLYLSPSVESELGYAIENYLGQNIFSYLNPSDVGKVKEMLSGEVLTSATTHEFRIKHKQGHEKVYEFSATDLRSDPAIGGIILNAYDITEKIKAREEINAALEKEMELSRQKTQFISTVSHEFRTPLTNISLNVQLLQKYLKDNRLEKAQLAINRLLNAERRLTALLNEVSLVSKDQSGRLSFTPEKWNIRSLTDDLLEQIDYLLQPNVNVKILESNNRQVLMDKNLLTHILGNFVSNAIKYSPKKNSIEVVIGLNLNDEYEIRVIDQGVGIPKEEQQFLFDPYFRASNAKDISGTGLGLNIAKRCVELHGGKLVLSSDEGTGTEIAAIIPLHS